MIREEYLRRLVDRSYVDLYLSATDGARIYWPWRMMPVHEASRRYRDACERYIIDSSFNREDITNPDVLKMGDRMDAEAVVLADVWHDIDATVEALADGVELYADHGYDGTIVLPLQPPHDECYERLSDRGVNGDYIYAAGGIKDEPAGRKITALRSLRDVAGDDAHIHGLGIGVSDRLVSAVRDDPGLVDSIDYSTPVQDAMSTDVEAGDERMSVVAAEAGTTLIRDLRRLSPYPDHGETRDTSITEWS